MALVAASSSSSAQSLPKNHDVFISFRGEDTRSNFTSHLYDAFCRKHIITFIDYQLPKGDDISPSLLRAIEDSYVSVVVFSKNYASSRWCLDELAHILHCKRVHEQIVVPVFYKVEPSHVRNQTGVYMQAFETYERDLKVDQHKMQMWKQALNEAANLAGHDSSTFRDESQMIQKIVEDILQKLNLKYPPADLGGLVAASSSSSSSSSAQSLPKKYDVFISLMEEDTGDNFTCHLYHAFHTNYIRVFFMDYQHPKVDEISPSLLQAIDDSHISVVVFSEKYASSRWCLNELVCILQCKRVEGQIVIPVFYKVEPSHVRNQTGGLYKKAFENYEADLKVDQHKMQLWKHALNEAANLSGYDSHKFRDESQMIQKIVEDILQILNDKYPPSDLEGLVGIDDNCAEVDLLLRDAETIGIWGMGGIGKSTIAYTIFSRCSSHYDGSCFLANVREESERGLGKLRSKFLSCLLKEDICIDNSSTFLESRLSRMKVFVVLDDISAVDQLNCLVGRRFCQGSKILITTRDKHVLSQRVDAIYEVKGLDLRHSFELFKLNAFKTHEPMIRDEELIKRAIAFAKGNPFTLKVLGSYLHGRNEVEWKSALKKFEKCPHQDIQKVVRLSYD